MTAWIPSEAVCTGGSKSVRTISPNRYASVSTGTEGRSSVQVISVRIQNALKTIFGQPGVLCAGKMSDNRSHVAGQFTMNLDLPQSLILADEQ